MLQGCQEDTDPFEKLPHPWSAFHSDDYGYTRMNILNKTHVYMEQVSDDQVCISLFEFWFIEHLIENHSIVQRTPF